MNEALLLVGDAIGVLALLSVFYAPFAASVWKAMAFPFLGMFLWGVIRITTMIFYVEPEPDPPLIGFIINPFFYAGAAAGLRSLDRLFWLGGKRPV